MNDFSALDAAISRATGRPFTTTTRSAVGGGCIHRALTLGDGTRRYFVKLNSRAHLPLFEAEADGLAALDAAAALRVPRVICTGSAGDTAYLVLEQLDLADRGDAAALGQGLAALHRVSDTHFGWRRDNFIGATPQPNAWAASWVEFLRTRRLGFQFALAAHNGLGGRLAREGEKLLPRLDAFFTGYQPRPSLLHGDLWGGNHAYLADGRPVVFDPAVYFGDRECDLAMSELFGGFAPAFHAAYREAWPLDPGYAVRKTLYNLYHILNHANLFGGAYVGQAERMAAQLNAELS